MAKERQSERTAEARAGKQTFSLAIPQAVESQKEVIPTGEKTSLFVPREKLLIPTNGFQASATLPDVLISRDLRSVLTMVFKYGEIGLRYGDGGLESDPSRQQIIIYTGVMCQGHLLWYQRSSPEDKKRKGNKFIGDPRLQGRYSIGFGGHKTREDIVFSREELVFLGDLLPAVQDEVGTILGLNRGLLSEVEEEIGLGRQDIKKLELRGAFFDGRIEDPTLAVQVGWVHTGIAALLEIDPMQVDHLTFRASEVARAWWVPMTEVRQEHETRMQDWVRGKGPKVETWTEIMLTEFMPEAKQP